MTAEELADRLRVKMIANRQPVERSPWSQHEHPRGWNDALDFVERTMAEMMGEKREPTRSDH